MILGRRFLSTFEIRAHGFPKLSSLFLFFRTQYFGTSLLTFMMYMCGLYLFAFSLVFLSIWDVFSPFASIVCLYLVVLVLSSGDIVVACSIPVMHIYVCHTCLAPG